MTCPHRQLSPTSLVSLLLFAGVQGALLVGAEPREVRSVAPSGPTHWIGLICRPLDKQLREKFELSGGLIVEEVLPDSPASKSGLRVGDVLVKFAAVELAKVRQLSDLVSEHADRKIELEVLRDGTKRTIVIAVAKRPAELKYENPVVAVPKRFPPEPITQQKMPQKETNRKKPNDTSVTKKPEAKTPLVKQEEPQKEAKEMAKPIKSPLVQLPTDISLAVGGLEGEPMIGTVSFHGHTWRVDENSVGKLPEEIREPIRLVLENSSSRAAKSPVTKSPPESPATSADVNRLQKRIESLEKKLDEILQLIKSAPAEPAKKVKKPKKEKA